MYFFLRLLNKLIIGFEILDVIKINIIQLYYNTLN